jgi:hypothetical protein
MSLTSNNIAAKIETFFASTRVSSDFIFIVSESGEEFGGRTYWRNKKENLWVDRNGAAYNTDDIAQDALAYFTTTDEDTVEPYAGSLGILSDRPYLYDGTRWSPAFGLEGDNLLSERVDVRSFGVFWLDVNDADLNLNSILESFENKIHSEERVAPTLIDVQAGESLALRDPLYGFHVSGYRKSYYQNKKR